MSITLIVMISFTIHGGVDGFSRKILWLVVATTNNDHLLLATYSLKYLEWIMGLKIPIVNICNIFLPMMKIVTLIASQFEISVLRVFGQE